jgi:hypothetical protein
VYNKIQRTSNVGTTVNTESGGASAPASTSWEKPQSKEGFDLSKPNSGIVTTKPLTAPVASNANRDALRAIVSREV